MSDKTPAVNVPVIDVVLPSGIPPDVGTLPVKAGEAIVAYVLDTSVAFTNVPVVDGNVCTVDPATAGGCKVAVPDVAPSR